MAVINNKKGGNAVIRVTSSGTVALTDLIVGTETISAASINSVCWSTNGTIQVARGAVTVLNLAGSGQWDLNIAGGSLTEGKTDSIAITITGTGTLLLGVSKESSITGLEQLS